MALPKELTISPGFPYPLGVSARQNGINFSVVSVHAKEIILYVFDRDTGQSIATIPLSAENNRSGNIWHTQLEGLPQGHLTYGYKVIPPFKNTPSMLLDPYARSVASSNVWGQNIPLEEQAKDYHPLGDIWIEAPFDWENDKPPHLPLHEIILYEMHVRAFTQHPSSGVAHPGTFLGVIEKIPYLLDLGVNAVELMPIQEFNETEYQQYHPTNEKPLYNFWGYSTVNFFAPMNRYASSPEPGAAIRDFKTMVKALHRNGIEVILDVVFNHTAEGNEKGPILSFKGLDNTIYYQYSHGTYCNATGTGNTVNANHPIVLHFILEALRYWVLEMHVDGFRFDLASALTRGENSAPMAVAPIIQAITHDPLLAKVKLIAEPWDAGGLYQVGHFAPETPRWSEWNDKYRDGVRRFIKGTGTNGQFATRLCGSQDLYKRRGPCSSINFITAHDGFTLADLVSYNTKHNLDNGENNQDGNNDNESWNCGEEGPTADKDIQALRWQQMRNFHLALMLSMGIPMLLMGDEYGHTKNGNNNTWCHDNELNWFLWDKLQSQQAFHRYYRLLIHFKKKHPKLLQRSCFLISQDIDWHGTQPLHPEWNKQSFIACTLKDAIDKHDLYVAFNAQNQKVNIQLPPPPTDKRWQWVVNTGQSSPEDIYEDQQGPFVKDSTLSLVPYSAILLEAR